MNTMQSTAGRRVATRFVRVVGILGCLAVTAIHVIDQNGLPGSESPEYVQILYYILEVAGIVAAILLVASRTKLGWFLPLGVAAGPILGYVLSRGPGLPDYTSDIGNWAQARDHQPGRRGSLADHRRVLTPDDIPSP
jgi:hypothetical protein